MVRKKQVKVTSERENVGNSEEVVTIDKQNDIMSSLKVMFDDFKTLILSEVEQLKKSVDFISNKFDNFQVELMETKNELKSVKNELEELKKYTNKMENEINDLQQYTRRDNILVFGVPECESECISETVELLSEAIHATPYTSDISIAHRLPTKTQGKIRPIVIRFCKRTSREAWMNCYKEASKKEPGRGVPLQVGQFPPCRFSAGDHLTQETKTLLDMTRATAVRLNYKFVWSRDGKVFVRKNEASRAKRIFSAADINSL